MTIPPVNPNILRVHIPGTQTAKTAKEIQDHHKRIIKKWMRPKSVVVTHKDHNGSIVSHTDVTQLWTPSLPPATWEQLHTYVPVNGPHDIEWLKRFSNRISIPYCRCKEHWLHYLAQHPPDWSNWFSWTVDAHNEVNKRLGKTTVSLSEAKEIWHRTG